jgi:hypothetical protein
MYIFVLWDWSQINSKRKLSISCKSDDQLIVYCFTPLSWLYHLYGDVTITGEGLLNFGMCSVLRAFEHLGIFIVLHQLWHGASFFVVSSEEPREVDCGLKTGQIMQCLNSKRIFEILHDVLETVALQCASMGIRAEISPQSPFLVVKGD